MHYICITLTYTRLHDNTLQYIKTHTHTHVYDICMQTYMQYLKNIILNWCHPPRNSHIFSCPEFINPTQTWPQQTKHPAFTGNLFFCAELALARNCSLTIRSTAAWSWVRVFFGAGILFSHGNFLEHKKLDFWGERCVFCLNYFFSRKKGEPKKTTKNAQGKKRVATCCM